MPNYVNGRPVFVVTANVQAGALKDEFDVMIGLDLSDALTVWDGDWEPIRRHMRQFTPKVIFVHSTYFGEADAQFLDGEKVLRAADAYRYGVANS